jgi:hypothetical protein
MTPTPARDRFFIIVPLCPLWLLWAGSSHHQFGTGIESSSIVVRWRVNERPLWVDNRIVIRRKRSPSFTKDSQLYDPRPLPALLAHDEKHTVILGIDLAIRSERQRSVSRTER